MQALILAGGEGTRLRPLTETIPKGAIELVDRPFLAHMIDWLGRHGVDDVVVACGFLADELRAVLGEGGDGSPRLRFVTEPQPLGTAGAIKFCEPYLGERFLALNGDVLTDLDLTELVRFHAERGSRATVGLYPVADSTGYGVIRRDAGGRVLEFLEKPASGEAQPGEINAGCYVLERELLDRIPAGRPVSIERDVFPELTGNGLHALPLAGYWTDIGTPERYLQASWDILERRVETSLKPELDPDGRWISAEAEIAPDARLGGSLYVAGGVRVGAGATIGQRAVLAEAVEVGAGARVESSVLHRGSRVGPGAAVSGAILSPGAEVGDRAVAPPGSFLAAGARIAFAP